ncbi:MAG TPA: hypothetical protein VFY29_15215 [Terriglobia bacterium]|nr:hypothetical protein [Terriglobia bacterium]
MDLMTAFVVVTALAVVGQGVALIAIFVQSKRLSREVGRFMDETRQMMVPMKTITENLSVASENLMEIGIAVRDQFRRVEIMIADTGAAIETQVGRFDRVSQDIAERINSTAITVQDSILRPFREVTALARGLGRGVETFLFRRPRRPVDQAHQDEELFI